MLNNFVSIRKVFILDLASMIMFKWQVLYSHGTQILISVHALCHHHFHNSLQKTSVNIGDEQSLLMSLIQFPSHCSWEKQMLTTASSHLISHQKLCTLFQKSSTCSPYYVSKSLVAWMNAISLRPCQQKVLHVIAGARE